MLIVFSLVEGASTRKGRAAGSGSEWLEMSKILQGLWAVAAEHKADFGQSLILLHPQ